MSDALKPCPFCGSEPELIDREAGPFIFGAYVCCRQCTASLNIAPTVAQAVEAWNTRAALSQPAPQVAPTVPEGYRLVPVEPTIAMLCDAVKAWEGPAVYKVMSACGLSTLEEQAADCYRAMLAAAPQEPQR